MTVSVKPAKDLKTGVQNIIDASIEDYVITQKSSILNKPSTMDLYKNSILKFTNGFKVKYGSKYIKILSGNSVHSFVVAKESGGFKIGDILMPASWAAPSKNKARGNILEGNYNMQWTGPLYLS